MSDNHQSWIPTRKWFATQITATAALIASWIAAAEWDKALTISLVGLVSQAAVGYLLPNANTPGGVPLRKQRDPIVRHGHATPSESIGR